MSDVEALARHLGEFGEIRITRAGAREDRRLGGRARPRHGRDGALGGDEGHADRQTPEVEAGPPGRSRNPSPPRSLRRPSRNRNPSPEPAPEPEPHRKRARGDPRPGPSACRRAPEEAGVLRPPLRPSQARRGGCRARSPWRKQSRSPWRKPKPEPVAGSKAGAGGRSTSRSRWQEARPEPVAEAAPPAPAKPEPAPPRPYTERPTTVGRQRGPGALRRARSHPRARPRGRARRHRRAGAGGADLDAGRARGCAPPAVLAQLALSAPPRRPRR